MAAVRAQKAQDIEEEYNSTLRSQSKEMEALLETQEIIISPVLHNMMVHRRTSSEIELAMANYFDATTEALEMCRQLLQNIKDAQSNYQSMDSFLASISASHALDFAFTSNNPFCTTTRNNFRPIHDKYSCILQSIRSSHRRVGRKLKMVKAVKKLSRALVVMAGGAATAAAFGTGAHLLFFGLLLIGTATTGPLKTWLAARASTKKPSSKTMSSLLQLQEQLDTAAKGTYVVGQDLDTVSNLVARLSDAIERENAMARWCAERADKRSSVLEMVNELRRSCSSSKRLTDELEEHVCLFLATIHRARNLVIQEISKKA
ncbi:unnamed protein product [Miscanthus lutarioriparius]|uniref:Uncharacterized protein n=1 Tax=Miscanthus lutarioriparius TaxID=422564 RepID=A0A811QWI2_9POAL|nr:unnamed protein product [Miscanthus lutarioriparius]